MARRAAPSSAYSRRMITPPNPYATVTAGGVFNQPDYLAAYCEAARVLMETGRLKQLAMPILYLQRHTVELLLKKLRDVAHHVIKSMQEIQQAKGEPVMTFTEPRKKYDHDLGELLRQAEAALNAAG